MTLPFFAGDAPLWRISINASSPHADSFGDMLIDWGGAQRWVRGEPHVQSLQRFAAHGGGHCTLFRGGDRSVTVEILFVRVLLDLRFADVLSRWSFHRRTPHARWKTSLNESFR